ncbi:helix-turn-helix domain-containing protein [Halopiger djelfimassiliensis]|uniref:helix-turn-helix domain-containing protein n=1 Tax=Halopiger djelfimassiliensis TaxID=1293047 RepID=UPI0006781FD6|nr:helix-turn-helix domain-containing protein [Halopiger djelfimassiliensis]
MYEATFSIADTSAYAEPTAESDCRIELWCNDHSDLLYVRGEAVERVLAQVESDIGIAEQLRGDSEAVVITNACLKSRETTTIEKYLERHNCLLLPPLRYEAGAKHCRILALDSGSLTEVYTELLADDFAIDVRSKREIETPVHSAPLVTLDEVFPELTARQRTVLRTAVENGYYELPRATTTEAIADELGVSRRTAEDHLRRAEQKLIPPLVSYLY